MSDHRSEQSRALLALAREGGLPNDAELARARARVAEKIRAGVVVTGAVGLASRSLSTKATAWSTSIWLKTATAIALAGGGVAAVEAHLSHGTVALPQTSRIEPAWRPPAGPAGELLDEPATTEAMVAPTADEEAPEASVLVEQAESPRAFVVPRAVPSAGRDRRNEATTREDGAGSDAEAVDVPALMERPPGLMDDVAHLREAQRWLASGDPTHAREEAERVREDGPLAEEGEGVRVLAACAEPSRAGEAHALADAFARRRPGSALLPRIRAACSAP